MQSRLPADRLAAAEAWLRGQVGASMDDVLTYLGDRSVSLTEFQREFRARRKAD